MICCTILHHPLKGYELAIRTLAAIEPRRRPRLVIAGAPTPGAEGYAAGLVRLAADVGVAQHVDFVGAQSRTQVAVLLRDAALLLLTSHSETYGLVALEAAASGTPVVSTRSSGMAVSVRDGVSGVLLDGRAPETWAAAVVGLLEHPDSLHALSASAALYGSQHSWRRTAEAILELYRRAAHP